MSKDGQLSAAGVEALRKRFQEHSNKVQAYYTIMHAVRELAGSDEAASAWMEQAVPALGGKTPAQLAGEGRAEDVLAYIAVLKSGTGN